ncbi:MAG: isoprenoid biosynthesis glyoxalase ElbB [Bacteriovoracia bacterium]
MGKFAVVLCGSGYLDGSEIRESVATLLSLSQRNKDFECFAPDAAQTDVMNCLTGKPAAKESRNMLVEAARIARGKVSPLDHLNPTAFEGLILPGGFGAAKNLCSFATQGASGRVIPELQSIIERFHGARRPIGAICIAPAIVALALRNKGIRMTVGTASEASQEIEKSGHKHVECSVTDCVSDPVAKVVTTPAYMYGDAKLHEIFTGIGKLVGEVIQLTR